MKNTKNNAAQALAGAWRILPDPDDTGKKERWFRTVPGKAQPAPVPGIIQQVFPDYHGVAWYWLPFKLNISAGCHDRVLLRFGAVDYLAEVWLNNQPVGGHEGGETPFSYTAHQRKAYNLGRPEPARRRGVGLFPSIHECRQAFCITQNEDECAIQKTIITSVNGSPEYMRSDNRPEFIAKEVQAQTLFRFFSSPARQAYRP